MYMHVDVLIVTILVRVTSLTLKDNVTEQM